MQRPDVEFFQQLNKYELAIGREINVEERASIKIEYSNFLEKNREFINDYLNRP
ncbi:hypothetical protein KO489_02820 [Reinekea forsetii]|nr:hypothetical protein [Reinekea forsetii]